jgi:lipoprotein NlpI
MMENVNRLQKSADFFNRVKDLQIMKRPHFKYYLAASVSLITFLVYFPSLQNNFVEWDDPEYVLENPFIRSFNAALFKWAFFDFSAGNWHPLTWISHALDYALWGLNPLGHHLTNNILHAANAFLVVLLVVRLVEIGRNPAWASHQLTSHDSPFTLIAAATTGLLFGLHPLHVESVAWVAERKDLLCALFFLLSIMMYAKYVGGVDGEAHGAKRIGRSGARKGATPCALRLALCADRRYLTTLGLFVLALFSKPMAVSLPLVLLILDWYPFNRIQSLTSFRSAFFEKLPFMALSLISSMLTILAQKAGGALQSMEAIPFSSRVPVAAKALIAYLENIILPINLSPFYPYPKDASLFSLEYLSAIILAVGITAACVIFAKKWKLFLSGWGYYVLTLIPVLGIVQVGEQSMADRYMYLPSLGPFLLIGLGGAWISVKAPLAKEWGKILKLAAAAAAVFALVAMAFLTLRQIGIWNNSIGLWSYVIEKEPARAYLAYDGRGVAYIDMGQLDKAMEDFNKSIAINPSFYKSYNNRGAVYSEMGQLDKAMEDFNASLALNPRCDEAYNNRGMVYGKTGSLDKAIEEFSKSLTIKPYYHLAYGNRGLAYSLIGEYAMALKDLNKAIELDSKYTAAYGNRGNLYLKMGSKELALSDFQQACALGDTKGCDVINRYAE